VHPIERLRYVAQSADADPVGLAVEAAYGLADLAVEPRALVLACRRLIDAQPQNALLWWVSAHVLAATDPAEAARSCTRRLEGDLTGLELAYGLPGGAVVAVEAASSVLEALSERPDCSLRVVGEPGELRVVLAGLANGSSAGSRAVGVGPQELEAAIEGTSLVLVEALAASSSGVLLAPLAARLVDAANARGVEVWVAAGTGRVLPEALFEAYRRRGEARFRKAELIDKVATAAGLYPPAVGLDARDCPAPATLQFNAARAQSADRPVDGSR
jgi:hypothetical protein